MRGTAILAITGALALLTGGGCGRPHPPGPGSPGGDSWGTYTSPDARVRFDHPAVLAVRIRPPRDADAPHLALSASTPDDSIQVTLVVRLSDDPMPNYCAQMMDSLANANTTAAKARQELAQRGGRGFRQEFREGHGAAMVELITVAFEAQPVYVHMTCGYPGTRVDLRPACERIIGSLAIEK